EHWARGPWPGARDWARARGLGREQGAGSREQGAGTLTRGRDLDPGTGLGTGTQGQRDLGPGAGDRVRCTVRARGPNLMESYSGTGVGPGACVSGVHGLLVHRLGRYPT